LASTDALRIEGLQAFYDDTQVLRDVDLTLGEGMLLGLLGRNGAGKSTCIGAISGLIRRQARRLELFGQTMLVATPEMACHSGIGLVPQGRRVFPSLTVEENLGVARISRPKARWSIGEVVKLFPRLGERRRQYAGTLSGGEQQMLAIGRALMSNPSVLLLDEPSEGLAPKIVVELTGIIARLKQEGMSIVLVEQNLHVARELADELVVLNTGQVGYTGDVATFAADEQLIGRHLGVF
jgi:branched-chain amino acid transport system ATP-binding protein